MHYDAMWPKEVVNYTTGESKTAWVRVGRAFVNENKSIDLRLDVLPIQPWDGRLILFPQTDKG